MLRLSFVDNNSSDNSVAFISNNYKNVKLIKKISDLQVQIILEHLKQKENILFY